MARVVVIGAGVTGLAVAARLADFGHAVTVFERRPFAGGQVSREPIDGQTADLGPAVLTLPAVFRDLFAKTGRRLDRELELLPVDPSTRYVFGDGSVVDLPNASRAGTTDALDAVLGPGRGAQWDGVMRRAERMWHYLRPRVIERPATRRQIAAMTLLPAPRRALGGSTTLREFGTAHLGDARLRDMLESHASMIGADPSRAPAALAVLPYLEQTFGLWTVRGGLSVLVDALERRARERGATLHLGTAVTDVVADGGHVRGVRVDAAAGVVAADVVVSTVSPEQLHGHLVETGHTRRFARYARGAGSVFSVFAVGTAEPARPLRTVVLGAGEPPIVVFAPHAGPGAAPSWQVHVACPAHGPAPHEIDWTAPGRGAQMTEAVLDRLERHGIDLRSTSAVIRARTPADLERVLAAPGGRVHGAPWAAGPAAWRRRPANRSSLRGLYVAGAGARPGPGLPMVGISAALVADMVGRA